MSRKARGDSVLKTLTEARQQEVVEYLLGHTLDDTRQWLDAAGTKASRTALSEFLSWYQLRSQFRGFEQSALTMIDLLRRKRPDLPEEDLQSYASEFFQLQAVQKNDPETYLAFETARFKAGLEKQKLRMRQEQLRLDRERFEWDAAAACLKELPALKVIAADTSLSNDQKVEAARLKLFGVIAE